MRTMTGRTAGRLSLLLVMAMLQMIIVPTAAIAGKAPKEPIVISSFTDSTGSININAGKAEGIKPGQKGVILRDGKEIAQYTVEVANWGFSKISVAGLAEGETVKVGDSAPITGASPSGKSKRNSTMKLIGSVLAVGALAYLLTRNNGGDDGSTRSGDSGITLKAEKTTNHGDTDTSVITITATVKDPSGNTAPDGTVVTFSTTTGKLNRTSAATSGGQAAATLTAEITEAAAVVTVKSLDNTATITVSFGSSVDIQASHDSIQIGGSGGAQTQSTITATCQDAKGNPATSGSVTFTSNIGTFTDDEVTITNGVATTTFSSNATGTATIKATWMGTQATTDVTVTAGPPYAVTVTSSTGSLSCDGSSHATITANVADIGGHPVTDGTVVDFSVTPDNTGGGNGSIVAQATTSSGKATASLYTRTAAGAKSESGTATVTGQVLIASQPATVPAPAADLSGSTTVRFISSEVGAISLGTSKANIRGWDVVGNTTTLTAVVRDTDGYAVPDGTVVTFSATHGMVSNVTTTSNGTATATLTGDASGSGSWNGLVDVTATAGGVSVTETGLVIFSGAPDAAHCAATPSPDPITLAGAGGQAIISVQVQDVNGNPVVDGTSAKAAASKGTVSPSSGSTGGGMVVFTLATSTDAASPTQSGSGVVTITIETGNGGAPVVLTVPFTVN